jgi:hypothetical protein
MRRIIDARKRLNKTFWCGNVVPAAYNLCTRTMAKKQANVSESAAAASAKRAAKPNTPRVQTAKHSKVTGIEQAAVSAAPEHAAPVPTPEPRPARVDRPVASISSRATSEVVHEKIAKVAYAYWESRGRQHGYALDDWIRAESELGLHTA